MSKSALGVRTIACVAGARPNFIKISPILKELSSRECFLPRLIHTGQHFSEEMSESFFRDLEIPAPDANLGVGGGTHTQQTAKIMLRIESVFEELRPDLVLVVGDVNSTVAAALTAAKMRIPVAHVEAGLRSFDRTMPEEVNRVVTDAVSDYLFTTEPSGERNLLAEGISKDHIVFVGNVMIDTLLAFRQKVEQSDVLERMEITAGTYAVVTLHRPSNVDEDERLCELMAMLGRLSEIVPIVFPIHPRTRSRLVAANIETGRIILTEALGYLDFIHLVSNARMVLTDSGGVQEETTILQVPCLTLRDNTERPITVEQGTNRLVGSNPENAFAEAVKVLSESPRRCDPPQFWDGQASRRIADSLTRMFGLS